MILDLAPGRTCLWPGLGVFVRLLDFGYLVPAFVVVGVIVATGETENGDTNSGGKNISACRRIGVSA